MPSFFFDNKQIEYTPGEDVLSAALRVGEFIPHYCYHPGLSRVATCRMCMIDVVDAGNGRPIPKLQTACTTKVAPNMKIITANETVKIAREAVMEFLLINHPLDCPICDQAGECSLQDYSFQYGTGNSAVQHEKRIYGLRDIGSFLQLERNRCIHCTRCVRFTEEISGTHEIGMFGRNHQLTVDTFVDYPLSDFFQGNLADICPVGAITMKDFRFKKRVWKLKKTASVCTGCSTGCNIWVNHHDETVYRFSPKENQKINQWWMCDIGRISFHPYVDPTSRRSRVSVKNEPSSWNKAHAYLQTMSDDIKRSSGDVVVLVSAHETCEEIYAIQTFANALSEHSIVLGVAAPEEKPVTGVFTEDLIMNDKTPNRAGLNTLGVKLIADPTEYLAQLDGIKLLIVVGNEFDRFETLAASIARSVFSIVVSPLKSVFDSDVDISFPSLSHLEKNGHFINKLGMVQKNTRAIAKAYNTKDTCLIFSDLCQTLFPNDPTPEKTPEDIFSEMSGKHDVFDRAQANDAHPEESPIPSQSYYND